MWAITHISEKELQRKAAEQVASVLKGKGPMSQK
jgi:hypothetical protein